METKRYFKGSPATFANILCESFDDIVAHNQGYPRIDLYPNTVAILYKGIARRPGYALVVRAVKIGTHRSILKVFTDSDDSEGIERWLEIEKLLLENDLLEQEVTSINAKPGPKPKNRSEKTKVRQEWDKVKSRGDIRLEEFLDEKFGSYLSGDPKVPRSTFYGWPDK